MGVLSVIRYPDPRLRRLAKPVTRFDAELKQFVADMIETMYHDGGIGLAAAQVADERQLFVMDISPFGNDPRCYINPVILDEQGSDTQEEGCLSFPGVHAMVTRAQQITLKALNEVGDSVEIQAEGLLACCMLHEIDHLKGKMFIDYLSPLKRSMAEKKYKKMQKVGAE